MYRILGERPYILTIFLPPQDLTSRFALSLLLSLVFNMRVSKTALLFVQAATAVVAQAIAEAECAALTVLEISTIRTVVINQYYGENTVINIEGGVVINIDNAPTSVDITTVVTVTSTSTVTAAPTAAA